jgi:hypothetical protein
MKDYSNMSLEDFKERKNIKDYSNMSLEDFKEELPKEIAWRDECRMNLNLSIMQIEYLKNIINVMENEKSTEDEEEGDLDD